MSQLESLHDTFTPNVHRAPAPGIPKYVTTPSFPVKASPLDDEAPTDQLSRYTPSCAALNVTTHVADPPYDNADVLKIRASSQGCIMKP
jgi:hypothetical protein